MAHSRRPSKRARADRAAVETARLRGSVRAHIESLGLSSEREYRAWCRQRGLSDGLYKSEGQKRKERDLARTQQGEAILARKRSQTRNVAGTIRQLYDRQLGRGRLGFEYLYRIRSTFRELDPDPPARRALLEILLAVEPSGKLFGPEPALPHAAPGPQNTWLQGLQQLARRHAEFVRPPAGWEPASHNARRQFGQLARHLLARYPDVPDFLDAAWLVDAATGAEEERRRLWQSWFLHLGAGGNLRAAPGLPLTLSKRMAHEVLRTPDLTPVVHALRRGQILGQGGWQDLVDAVVATRLGAGFAHEEFWSSVLTFLVRHPMLDPAQVGPVVDYLQQQKFEGVERLQPGGEIRHEPPPQPNLTMKSRSIDKLLRQVEEWHEELAEVEIARRAAAPATEAEGGSRRRRRKRTQLIEFESGAIGDFEAVERVGKVRTTWRIRRLRSNADLAAEGRTMHHCVLSYAKSCRKGSTSIWSLTARDDDGPETPVLTIAMSGSRAITQVRGRFNAQPWGRMGGSITHDYMSLMKRGAAILRRWIDREKLVWGEVRM